MTAALVTLTVAWLACTLGFVLWADWRMAQPLTRTDEECARIDAEIDAAKKRHPAGRAR